MNRLTRINLLGIVMSLSSVFCISSLAQDSLRYENMSCISSTNPDDIQEGLTFSMKVTTQKKTKFIEVDIDGYPGEDEPMNFVFGRTTDLGSGNVVWKDSGEFMLSRAAKGKRWIIRFGAVAEGKTAVPCQLIKITSSGNDLLMYQLVFASAQVEQVRSFLKQAVENNIIKQTEL